MHVLDQKTAANELYVAIRPNEQKIAVRQWSEPESVPSTVTESRRSSGAEKWFWKSFTPTMLIDSPRLDLV